MAGNFLEGSKSKSILDLSHKEACAFFLKSKSYCTIELPKYFNFTTVLTNIDSVLMGKELSSFLQNKPKPRDYDNINYKILNNKNGRYAWRPLQLIHPALYVSLVHQITGEKNWTDICKRFKDFTSNSKIECISIPRESLTDNSDKAEQISNWWYEIEQKSIEMAIDYECLTCTDITDCYGAIYTHSISWALHDKDKAKDNKKNNKFIGNIIDSHLQDMSHGQTNGIPQGSALMDFIAEMLLGYADTLLTAKIEKEEIYIYKILRYRDDYRIFTNNLREGEQILKCLTEVMINLGLKLNNDKTKSTRDVVTGSIKSDKLYLIQQKQNKQNLRIHLLTIHELAKHFPNSGSLNRELEIFYKRLSKVKQFKENVSLLISIIVDIAYKNPRTYPYAAAIISCLLSYLSCNQQKSDLIHKIRKKFNNIPNTGHLMIWLQRITLGIKTSENFDELLCKLVLNENNQDVQIWNNSWLNNGLKKKIETGQIIDRNCINTLPAIISEEEIELFKY